MDNQPRFIIHRFLLWLLLVPLAVLFPLMIMFLPGAVFEPFWARALLFLVICSIDALLLKRLFPTKSWVEVSLAAGLISGVVYRLAVYLPDISTYPLSLDWSETSRYYYASLFFSRGIYGISIPLSVLHPTRYLMQAVPFIVPGLPLWFHRFWQVLLWVFFTFGAALLLMKKLAISQIHSRFLFVLWIFLFLLQGPVYYHLLVICILVLWGFDKGAPWRTLVVTVLASLWAGVSRINWAPVPGMLAAVMYLCEVSVGKKPFWRYLGWPLIWTVLGTATAFLSQAAYVRWSGNPPEYFGSSLTSDLLWYRLFPSATYPLGVIPAVVLACAPLLLLMGLRIVKVWPEWHFLRLLGLGAILSVLFLGGLVVSAKIGGGSNLHNLDAFLAMFCVVASYVLLGRTAPETLVVNAPGGGLIGDAPWNLTRVSAGLLLLAGLAPAGFAISLGGKYAPPDKTQAENGIAAIKEIVEESVQNGNEVLFVSERHLLTFQAINAPLFPDYEKVFLMEMAMSNNQAYLSTFYDDLHKHRFAIIVIHPQRINYQGAVHVFGEENDAWVKRVTEPLLCEYKSLMKLPDIRVELFVPREGTRNCP